MTDKEIIKASKFLSLILRHEPERAVPVMSQRISESANLSNLILSF